MEEYAERLIKRHTIRMLGDDFKLAMKTFTLQRRELERIIPDLIVELPRSYMVVRVIKDNWIEDRIN